MPVETSRSITELPPASNVPTTVIETIGKRLRNACGCGGTVKDKRIELQGDNITKIRAVLEASRTTLRQFFQFGEEIRFVFPAAHERRISRFGNSVDARLPDSLACSPQRFCFP